MAGNFRRLIALLGASTLVYMGPVSSANSAQSNLEKFASIQTCHADGHFEIWSPDGQLVLLNDNHFFQCDLETGNARPTDYSPPRTLLTIDEMRANSQKALGAGDTFPAVIRSATASTDDLITWTHIAPLYFKYDANYLPVERNLISRDQGELAIYTAPPIGAGNGSGESRARFAFAYRKDAQYKMIDIELQPHKHKMASGYPWGHLASSKDYATGRVLLFFDGEALSPDTKYIDGWSPFNVWWFDPGTVSLTHLVLPDGTWVKDADKPRFISNLRNYPVGVGSTYEIQVGGGKIFLLVEGTLSDSSLGIWMFEHPGDQWKKIANKGVELKRISPDGCKLAVDRPPSVTVLNLCDQI